MATDETTQIPAKTLLRTWANVQTVKKQLIDLGLLTGDATPAQIIAKLREVLPPEAMK